MCVDANGRFVSQREVPALARLTAIPHDGGLTLALDGDELQVATPSADAARLATTVWASALPLPEAEEAGAWLSARLGQALRLVHQPDDAVRPVGEWGQAGDETSLSDGFPVMIANAASMQAVNRAGGLDMTMARYRPNLVVDGAEAWAEDGWARLRIGECELELVKPCPRCTVTTVDQESGRFDGEEPLATLRRVRMSADRRVAGVLFGWNAIARRHGRIRVGDAVEVLETRAPWAIRGADAADGAGAAGA